MQELGLNTLECFMTRDLIEACAYLDKNEGTLLSMRTERGYEFLCPFYYLLKPMDLLPKVIRHLEEGYLLLLYPALDKKDSLAFGTVATLPEGGILVEFVEGIGLVRELDTHPHKKSLEIPAGSLKWVTNELSPFYREINEIIYEVRDLCWDEGSCIVEWSYYKIKVGSLQKNPIYWELRNYR